MSKLALNVRVYGDKTLLGSMAVFAGTYLTISYECTDSARVLISAAACVGEALGGEWDNAVIAGIVLAGWWGTGMQGA